MLAACGSAPRHVATPLPSPRSTSPALATESHRRGSGLAIGLTEPNPNLIWSSRARPHLPPTFAPWRDRLAALHPDYLRVLVDWAKLQPDPRRRPDLAATADGCERGVGPCLAYAGLRDLFAAIASNPALTPVVVIYGAPAWAARAAGGCERSGTLPAARALAPAALPAYRALIASLISLGRGVGLELPWWSPWNEPNHPYFISPQRARCDARASALSPAIYAGLARAMRGALDGDRHPHGLVLGDLAGFTTRKPLAVSVGEFVAALPSDVACASHVWAVHYGLARSAARAQATVTALERALARRGGCAARARIWVTEAGAPTDGPGAPGDRYAAASCRELAAALDHWNADPKVDAVFQYTFRQDPLFALGLADTGLTRTYPAYALLRAWGGRAPGDPPPDTTRICA